MTTPPSVAIARALSFLARAQLPSGQFPCESYGNEALTTPPRADVSPFATALIVRALGAVRDDAAKPLIERGIAFLFRQQESNGTWRFWPGPNQPLRVDPDADDTACVADALQQLAPTEFAQWREQIDAALLASTRSGVFTTWLRNPSAPNDIDMVVNANVATYFGRRLPALRVSDSLCEAVSGPSESSSYFYYLDPQPLRYAFARAVAAGAGGLDRGVRAVVDRTTTRQSADGSFGNELITALALSTLALCDAGASNAEAGEAWLLTRQSSDGSWPRAAYFTGPEPPRKHAIWWGSSTLTTAFAIEAMEIRARRHSAFP